MTLNPIPSPLMSSGSSSYSLSPIPSPLMPSGSLSYSQQNSPFSTEHRPPVPLVDLTNSFVEKSPTSPDNKSLLNTILGKKKVDQLPAINKAELLDPQMVIDKYPKLLVVTKIPALAVRLSKESYFGRSIMALCTV